MIDIASDHGYACISSRDPVIALLASDFQFCLLGSFWVFSGGFHWLNDERCGALSLWEDFFVIFVLAILVVVAYVAQVGSVLVCLRLAMFGNLLVGCSRSLWICWVFGACWLRFWSVIGGIPDKGYRYIVMSNFYSFVACVTFLRGSFSFLRSAWHGYLCLDHGSNRFVEKGLIRILVVVCCLVTSPPLAGEIGWYRVNNCDLCSIAGRCCSVVTCLSSV